MKLISYMILIMYLTITINAVTCLASSISVPQAGFDGKFLIETKGNLSSVEGFIDKRSMKRYISDYVTDIPEIDLYDWEKVKKENHKTSIMLRQI